MKPAYYNENDKFAAEWLRNLIAAGHIAAGDVDERSIVDVQPDDLRGYTQCHFFAGIGVWSYALRLAGFPDARSVWTGSCPCQPFSAAGKGRGHEDERHLWPAWLRLIRECSPELVLGEQVASVDGRAWLDVVLTDLEVDSYAVGAADLPAAGVGAPHIRQRLFFMAHAHGRFASEASDGRFAGLQRSGQHRLQPAGGGPVRLAEPAGQGPQGGEPSGERPDAQRAAVERGGTAGELGDASRSGREELGGRRIEPAGSATAGFWRDADWIACRDGKARPVEPGTFPLVDGAPARVGRLRGYGNAIVAPVAATFIAAACEVIEEHQRRHHA